ncbi:MAG: hypothetical protein PHF94_01595 [Methanothrix sp.]|nr:hypothetical protein [Methanothrix sp.]
MEGLWIDEIFFHLISLEEKMRPIPNMASRDPTRFSSPLSPKAAKAALEKICEADAIVLAGIYSLDVSNFVPGQRTR